MAACDEVNKAQTELETDGLTPLAFVNGKIISQQDVIQQLDKVRKGQPANQEADPRQEKATLDRLIQKELKAQKALELGLDDDPEYVALLQRMDVRMNSFKREQLSRLFDKSEIQAKANVSNAEIDKFIAEKDAIIRYKSHILQILQRDQEKIQHLSEQLLAGASFDDVAREVYPKMPNDSIHPWDQGYMKWEQIPDAWVDTLIAMQPGDTSGIIKGPRNRFWIIQLVDRKIDESSDMALRRLKIREILQHEKEQQLKKQVLQALHDAADITYLNDLPQ
jgi:hypothetical protein